MNAKRTLELLLLVGAMMAITPTQAGSCAAPSAVKMPPLYSVGWIPWLGDLKSWRNYDPTTIPGIGRLINSPDGTMVGEPLAGSPTCNILPPGEYTYVMQWQTNQTGLDYIQNTDIIYLLQPIAPTPEYIRHSQMAAGLPVFCAGTFKINDRWWPNDDELSMLNAIVEVTTFSGHYKPKCSCLAVLEEKLHALGVSTAKTEYKFMGSPADCQL